MTTISKKVHYFFLLFYCLFTFLFQGHFYTSIKTFKEIIVISLLISIINFGINTCKTTVNKQNIMVHISIYIIRVISRDFLGFSNGQIKTYGMLLYFAIVPETVWRLRSHLLNLSLVTAICSRFIFTNKTFYLIEYKGTWRHWRFPIILPMSS